MNILISVDVLAQRLSANRPRFLDVRWTVTAPDGRAAHRDGHIPGAVYVDLDAELSDHSVTGRGRHPLPSPQALQHSARQWGLNPGDPVVVYDDWSGQAASAGVVAAAGRERGRRPDSGRRLVGVAAGGTAGRIRRRQAGARHPRPRSGIWAASSAVECR